MRDYPIGIMLQNGMSYNIRPRGFLMLSREDIEWVASIAPRLFDQERQLRISDRELAVNLGFIDKPESKPFDDTEIRRGLSLSVRKMEEWLNGIAEPYLVDAIYEVAKTIDLPVSKIKVLQEKMPNKEFIAD